MFKPIYLELRKNKNLSDDQICERLEIVISNAKSELKGELGLPKVKLSHSEKMEYLKSKGIFKSLEERNINKFNSDIKIWSDILIANEKVIEEGEKAIATQEKLNAVLGEKYALRFQELPWKGNNPTDQAARAKWAAEELKKLQAAECEKLIAKGTIKSSEGVK